ncbi:MAG TPA: hypothetical protein VF017_11895 [Thermoanaerobaculia bacterium]|nr:hypothetical protein [Thermoanaerobaculia bacterium]
MKRWRFVILGGLAFYVSQFVLGFATGPLIHNGVLKETYKQHSGLWRPELNQDPPDMAALMPMWIPRGILAAFIIAWVFSEVRSGMSGPGWKRGLRGGFWLFLIWVTFALGYSGIFNGADKIWAWWGAEMLVAYLLPGAVLGWISDKLSPD